MEACERVDRTRDRIHTALRYTKLLLNEADPAGLVQLHGCIRTQMHLLHNTALQTDQVDVMLKFETNPSRFEEALNSSYGYFVNRCRSGSGGSGSVPSKAVSSLGLPTPSSTPLPPSPTHSSPLEGPPLSYPSHPSSILKNDLSHSVLMSSMTPSLADMGSVSADASTMSVSTMPAFGSMATMPFPASMTSIQEYNLQQLASLVGKSECQSTIGQQQQHHHQQQQQQPPAVRATPSPHAATTSPFTLADLLTGDMNVTSHAFTNLQALAKLGSNSNITFQLHYVAIFCRYHYQLISYRLLPVCSLTHYSSFCLFLLLLP